MSGAVPPVGSVDGVPDYADAVLSVVEQIPAGRVATYGDIAEFVGQGGPRKVGRVMSQWGAGVSWWRVIRADGRPATGLEREAIARLRSEGTPLRGDRVDLSRARWPFR
jgi:alkylated DNA nucleotide flippase Atl1